MQRVMEKLEGYPEGPVSMESWKTPCHAAAEMGNFKKLKILLSDVNKRYTGARSSGSGPLGQLEFRDEA